ncbi:MAG: response regulator [Sphingobacteriales bacterium]|uniref:response regulator n=1 Tax=Hydrotalea flava TaxID=714549 RepID=UPI000832CA62|nr:response regulator transcription factor [Hydrotalea flava]RTL48830.1 MAG: response regulator [Sphingobacteriales bacterium]
MIKVAIIEDNNTLRKSLSQLFETTEGMGCVTSLSNLMNVVSEFRKTRPDIVLMDIGLPNISGIEGVRTVKDNFPEIQVLMFTVFDDDEKIFEAIKAGASGYLLKKSSPEEITEAVLSLYQGGAPISASIARKVIQSFQHGPAINKEDFQLTTRENEILNSLVDGLSYKKLAEKYFISISTVRTHIQHIYEKLHVNSKAEAVAKTLKNR